MRVLEESPDRLRLDKGLEARWLEGLLYLLVFSFFATGWIMFIASVGPSAWNRGDRVGGVAAVLAGCLMLPISLLGFLALELHEGRNTEYQFDRQRGELSVVGRFWFLRSRQSEHYSLADFTGVSVVWDTVVEDYSYGAQCDICTVELQTRSGKSLTIYRDTPKRGEDVTLVTKALTRFLELPLSETRKDA